MMLFEMGDVLSAQSMRASEVLLLLLLLLDVLAKIRYSHLNESHKRALVIEEIEKGLALRSFCDEEVTGFFSER